MGSGTPCASCNLREENPAPQARIACRLSLPGQPAFMPRIKARRFLWEVGTSYNERLILWGVVRFVWGVSHIRRTPRRRREEGAGSACRASPAD